MWDCRGDSLSKLLTEQLWGPEFGSQDLCTQSGVVAQFYNPPAWEKETDGSLELAEPGIHKTLFSKTNKKLVREVSCNGVELITVGKREWGGGGGRRRSKGRWGERRRWESTEAAAAGVVSSGAWGLSESPGQRATLILLKDLVGQKPDGFRVDPRELIPPLCISNLFPSWASNLKPSTDWSHTEASRSSWPQGHRFA